MQCSMALSSMCLWCYRKKLAIYVVVMQYNMSLSSSRELYILHGTYQASLHLFVCVCVCVCVCVFIVHMARRKHM